MTPHSYKVGDTVKTTYGHVGVVTEVFAYSVTLDNRTFMSQTLIKELVR